MRRITTSAALIAASTATAQLEVFSTNFDSGAPAEFSGITGTESVGGFAGFGNPGRTFGGSFLRNTTSGNPASASTLTLTGLPVHDAITIDFLVALIDSWDSDNGSVSPDYFNVTVDGVSVLQITAANASGSNTYAGDQIVNANVFGGSFTDRAFDMGTEAALINIPHSSSTATISFFASGAGWQGGGDENWAIDNLSVSVRIPSPAPAAVLAFGGLAASRRRR